MDLVIIDNKNIVSVDRCQYHDHMQTNINILSKFKDHWEGEDRCNNAAMFVKNIIVFKDDESLKDFYMQLTDYMQNNNLI